MIRKLFLTLFSFGIVACSVYGQYSAAYKSKWQTKTPIGVNIPITKLLQGAETDYLFQYDDHSYYWQPFSISYFFHKHWGLEINYQIGISGKVRKRVDNFKARMQLEYGDNYYPISETDCWGSGFVFLDGNIQRGYLGAIFRLETNKFYMYPKFSIGFVSFDTYWGKVDLKEKNSNLEYKVSYSNKPYSNENIYFTLAPSISFGYKIFERFYLNADVILSHYKASIEFEKEFTNLYTQISTVEYFDYKKDVFTLSLGAGVIFVIR
jgi:hypothetical protein